MFWIRVDQQFFCLQKHKWDHFFQIKDIFQSFGDIINFLSLRIEKIILICYKEIPRWTDYLLDLHLPGTTPLYNSKENSYKMSN